MIPSRIALAFSAEEVLTHQLVKHKVDFIRVDFSIIGVIVALVGHETENV